jgi:hypothetical protein
MRHPPGCPQHPTAAFRLALAALLAAALSPTPASGQIPGVPRRARDAAARAAGVDTQPRPQCPAVVYDSVVQELTAARVEQMIKGMRARRDVLEGRRGGPSMNAMQTQLDAAANAMATLRERKDPEMEAYRDNHRRIEQCRIEAFDQKREARTNANMQRAMTDPDFMQRTAQLSQQMAEAQQRGDTAAMNRIGKQIEDLLSGTTREDTVAVDRSCGRLPSPPASLVQYDSLQALQDTLSARMRRREEEAARAAATASGLNAQQQAMAEERALMFLWDSASEGAMCGFSQTELSALKARRADLEEWL